MKTGDRVVYNGGETWQHKHPTIGVYTVQDVDDLPMTGYVEIIDMNGEQFAVNANLLTTYDGGEETGAPHTSMS